MERTTRSYRAGLLAASVALIGAAWPGCNDGPRGSDSGGRPDPERAEPALPEPVPPPPGPPPGIDHTLEEGETLWEIARAYDVAVSDIMAANELGPRDLRRLRAGQTLRIPGATQVVVVPTEPVQGELPAIEDGAYHRLADGETLWDVARAYEVSLDELMARNGLDDESGRVVRPGQALVIPGASERDVERVARARGRAGDEAAPRRARGFRHTVERGETIWDLASAFGVTVAEIMAANGLDEASVGNLREGTNLFIPGVERDQGGRVQRQLTGRQRRALALAARLGLGTRQAATAMLRGRIDPRWMRAAGRGDRRRLPGSLRWPVSHGWYVRGFGSGEGGYHLAVDIMGRIGWNVRAAAPGIVGYAGNEVPGYGNMVIVVHPGGWATMYAHNSANSVVAGEMVPRGGILGEVGSTGISRGPHVHFELMFAGKNCDPALLFRPGIRHRDGRLTPLRYEDWIRPDHPPEGLRCYPRRRHPRSRWVVHETFGD